jgi:Phosphotransferase enzyme family
MELTSIGRDSVGLLEAVAKRELLWLRKFGRPRYPQNPVYRLLYDYEKVEPDSQIKSLQNYLKIARFLVPDDREMNRPTIRHSDLSPSNILVSDDDDDDDIAGIIDWQHCNILPLFLQAEIPGHFQNYAEANSVNFRPPKLPENFESLSTGRKNPRHYHALHFEPHMYLNKLYAAASCPWEGDNTSLQANLISVIACWSQLCSKDAPECPIHYSEEESKDCLERHQNQRELDKNLQGIRNFLGVNSKGWTENDANNEARETADRIKREWIEEAETELERKDIEENFPFQDHEEIE